MALEYALDVEKRQKEEQAKTIHVSVYSYENCVARGVLRSMADGQKFPFCGFDQAALMIERILEQQDLPERTGGFQRMDFASDGWNRLDGMEKTSETNDREDISWTQTFHAPKNFLIRVHGRHNQSLQGELRMGDKKCCFRSGMELMCFMHQWLQIKSRESKKRGNRNCKSILRERGFTAYKRGRIDEL